MPNGHPSELEPGDYVLRKLGNFVQLDQDQRATLSEILEDESPFVAQQDIVSEGEPYRNLFLLTRGWAIRYKLLPDGRRQILSFVLPGDFFGLRATLFETASDSVEALTDCAVRRIPGEAFIRVLGDHPRLGMAIVWSLARETSVLTEQIVRLGRRSAYERTAHLLMELLRRLQLVGLAGEKDYELPLTQEILADTLGMSVVHVNRTLRSLREQGLIRQNLQSRWIILEQPEQLARVGDFDPAYLDQDTPPAATVMGAIRRVP